MNDGSNTTTNTNNDNENDKEPTNPYLALRQAKIARNQARLKELGLLSNAPPSKKPKPASRNVTTTTTTTKANTRGKHADISSSPPPPVIVRRSRRLSRQQQLQQTKANGEAATEDDNKKGEEEEEEEEEATTRNHRYGNDAILRRPKRPRPSPLSSAAKKGAPAPPAPNSVRSITLNPERLVLGDNNSNDNDDTTGISSILGVAMEKTGKEFVIYKSFERAAHSEDRARLEELPSSRLSFNKYSGVQEWKNVVFLWVNLGAPNGTVVNDFLEDGRQITWFGGSRMQEETPVVQKLLTLGKEAAASSMLILWCRRYNRATKSFLPYICLGRLSYHSHVPDSYPVSFVWNLLDYDKLVNSKNANVREEFQQCVNNNNTS